MANVSSNRCFLPCSGQAWSKSKRHWGIWSPVGPAWWRLCSPKGRQRQRLFASYEAAEKVALALERKYADSMLVLEDFVAIDI